MNDRRPTATSNFGVSRRESHDASGFYNRFTPPELSTDTTIAAPAEVDEPFVVGDARAMTTIADGTVALVVTSPPYFAGKQYEEELERDGVPASYLEYLEMLHDVFAECVRTLEPGGRIAVNVANLGRKPYRSLSADVIHILQDRLGLLIRGEIVWQKGEGASGSCAWGSFRSASNPVLRDVTERVIVASKGRFDRARSIKQRAKEGLPHRSTILAEDFMALTLDVWNIPAESAKRVGHPAPFPVELPEQLIRLYTFDDDLVLDPFMGSGSTLVAAANLGRRYVGYDLDPAYVDIARGRVAEVTKAPPVIDEAPVDDSPRRGRRPAVAEVADADAMAFERVRLAEGQGLDKVARQTLEAAGFRIVANGKRIARTGATISFVAVDTQGATWYFDVAGAFTSHRGGLQRSDVVWRSLGRAAALADHRVAGPTPIPLVLLTSHVPKRPSEGDTALRAVGPKIIFDVISVLQLSDVSRLATYATNGPSEGPTPGFWTPSHIGQ
jgi:DNA modification methylase